MIHASGTRRRQREAGPREDRGKEAEFPVTLPIRRAASRRYKSHSKKFRGTV